MPPRSIPIPRITLGKVKERSIMCNIRTIDGRFRVIELPAQENCVIWEGLTHPKKFLINPKNQFQAEDGHWHQTYDERSQIPLCLREQSYLKDGDNDAAELKEIGHQLFKITSDQTEAEQYEKLSQGETWNKVMWIISIVCGTMLLIAGMNYLGG